LYSALAKCCATDIGFFNNNAPGRMLHEKARLPGPGLVGCDHRPPAKIIVDFSKSGLDRAEPKALERAIAAIAARGDVA